jgi:hypothetical protein
VINILGVFEEGHGDIEKTLAWTLLSWQKTRNTMAQSRE